METKLKIIADTADITFEEARLAFELADGQVERALEMVPYVEKSFIIIQGKFTCGRTTKLYGIFRLLGNGKDGQLIDFGLAMSYSENDVQTSIEANPEAFKKVIDQLFKHTETTQVHSFLNGFFNIIGAAQINQFYQFIKGDKKKELEEYFGTLVNKIWGNSERVETEVCTYLLTKVQCEKKGLISSETSKNTTEQTDDAGLSIYLETEPIISAVKGKTIEKFASGELIPVKIIDQREVGNYLGQMLSNNMGIAYGKVIGYLYKELSARYLVTVEFGPKIYGRFVIDPTIRLDTVKDVELDLNSPVDDQNISKNISIDPALFLLLGMILMLLLFFIFTK